MWTAVLGTLNLLDGAGHDVWAVNADAEYLEEGELQSPLGAVRRRSLRSRSEAASPAGTAATAVSWCTACRPTPAIAPRGRGAVQEAEQVAVEGDLGAEPGSDDGGSPPSDAPRDGERGQRRSPARARRG